MTHKTTIVAAIASLLIGIMIGASITWSRMNIEHRYSALIGDKIHCYGLLRQIEMEPDQTRRSLERELARKVLFNERYAGVNGKIGDEARELLKMVSDHRKNSKLYIEEENAVRAKYFNN